MTKNLLCVMLIGFVLMYAGQAYAEDRIAVSFFAVPFSNRFLEEPEEEAGFIRVIVNSKTKDGAYEPLVGGEISTALRATPPDSAWKYYVFGSSAENKFFVKKHFVTNMEGEAVISLPLEGLPEKLIGFYELVISVKVYDSYAARQAKDISLPLKPVPYAVGIKAEKGKRKDTVNFSLIALSPDCDLGVVEEASYELYEAEGKKFLWYTDAGRWKYKLQPELKLIDKNNIEFQGGQALLSVPAKDLNYKLEIKSGKNVIAEASFNPANEKIIKTENNRKQNLPNKAVFTDIALLKPYEAPSSNLSMKITKLNGVPLQSNAKLTQGDIFVFALKGSLKNIMPAGSKDNSLLVIFRDKNIRPLGCPLLSNTDVLSSAPWLAVQSVSDWSHCEFDNDTLSVLIENPLPTNINIVFFAKALQATTADSISLPAVRIIK
ncbi:MAG: hypothetical protein FWF23_03460 [Alphaproteobacteria bacterium]|nr:hypothetical protein [Alphaproteobacteria bacterium]MCL2505448.1 hypothetical protein [Alphaproteobacteria bacterium]